MDFLVLHRREHLLFHFYISRAISHPPKRPGSRITQSSAKLNIFNATRRLSTMSSAPEWIELLKKHVDKKDQHTTVYAFSTLSPEGKPRVRHCIHRDITPSNLLLTTTDTRMQKPLQLGEHHQVEIAWWMEPPAVQFRLRGQAFTLPADQNQVSKALKELGVQGEEADAKWWEEKRKSIWANDMSGHLRGSFGRPPPGKPLSEIKEKPEDWPERLDAESDDPEQQKLIDNALSHFALIAFKVEWAEYLELKPSPNRRTQWTKKSDGSWDKVSVAP
ncbi:pyridoxamine 5'-phosphate oxidase-domain-containing protein [Kockovaella imperatae]|uniref:Pyridoxamine 5'-phosphate oxidase-domain-containing protein n=1 Tax=Kockovaella imperatae TaxID=4999 RepID=A0A1Y1UAA2_9TREE|nr:pyridoxamine 5'-phosphate oxidase-domain-containing protein [Kockovaella imperatae]ORX34005.1 pyridoxamine 5'-phosphate oxidase-domain-containing protein [Kockovaella imperatae]